MKMNKFYVAVATAALGLSSHAMALTFTDGNFTGGVDIGGDIAVPVATNQWQWAAGDAINFASTPVTQMTNSFKTLTIPVNANLPLLVGQTKAATPGNAGNAGLNPQIVFTNAAGGSVTPVWDNTGDSGKGTISVPVTADDGTTALGSMNIKVKVGATRAGLAGATVFIQSTSNISTGVGLYGPTALPSATVGVLLDGTTAAAWNAALGAVPATALLAQANTAAGTSYTTFTLNNRGQATSFGDPGQYYTGTYGLGIAQGDSITVNFTNPVTATTSWKSALKATVTYL
ncbi:hypothetical protein KBJ94_27905 [Pseudomonas sp. ITA]|uniref:F4 family fimbrial subunit n=1 Tax=Pseudomonas sp. ITA TaxID=2825841 RepID=UPI002498483D|nr:hypothetical protein [Pseudomonas sp. ITA]MDI2145874.1 hypothetical protein [Pseudomonas sp. ITA]